jgi:hypothetical protein
LTNFPTIFWALLPLVIFLTSFGYIFLYIFCGDPKMGYNNTHLNVSTISWLSWFLNAECLPFDWETVDDRWISIIQ